MMRIIVFMALFPLLTCRDTSIRMKTGKKKGCSSSSSEEVIIYLKPEDEILHNLSAWSFCFPLRSQQVTTNKMKAYRSMGLVMAVEATSVPSFRQQLHLLIDES